MSVYKTKKFEFLKKKWYKKLKDKNFDDIEDTNSPNEFLKRWDSIWFKSKLKPLQFKAREAYYQNAAWFLNVHSFVSAKEKKIWAHHANGLTLSEIAKKMKLKKTSTRTIVHRLGGLMNGLSIRDVTPDDMNFIYATWLRGLYYGSQFYGSIEKDVFFAKYESVIKDLLAKPGVLAKVSCLQDTPDAILAYAIYEPQKVLHYVFVKEAWRRQGLARSLIPGDIKAVTHLTNLGSTIAAKKDLKFNPWLI